MKKATIDEVTLDEARELYNSHNKTLKELALKCFSGNELKLPSFSEIKTFEDAVNVLNLDIDDVYMTINRLEKISKASAAMFKLNIIRKALNLGQDLHLIKNPEDSYIYYPYNPFIAKNSTYYKSNINLYKMEIIGKFKCEGEEYNVLSGRAFDCGGLVGLGCFYSNDNVGYVSANIGFLGCANKEIAKHLGKHFGMLITEAKYGNLDDFEIVEDQYGNA